MKIKTLIVDLDLSSQKKTLGPLQDQRLEVTYSKTLPSSNELSSYQLLFCKPSFLKYKELVSNLVIILLVDEEIKEKEIEGFYFWKKPYEIDSLIPVLHKIRTQHALLNQEESPYLQCDLVKKKEWKIDQIIAESSVMKTILEDIRKIAKSNASVLISGESGTGKEVVAQAIHSQSKRKDKPYIKVNCAAVPDTLIESEFFGHEKGSFTGALGKRIGRFEMAHNGTLLLDEVTEIPLLLQSKLLRVIQEQEFERVGGTHPVKVDVRLIATSNRNMEKAIQDNLFRADLYYRLNVIPVHLPPLRERKEDILPLAHYFLKRFAKENDAPVKQLSACATEKLLSYNWPGNIRELANVIERCVVMVSDEHIRGEHLSIIPSQKTDSAAFPKGLSISQLERQLILQALKEHNQNRTRAAHALGISLRTLRNKLSSYEKS